MIFERTLKAAVGIVAVAAATATSVVAAAFALFAVLEEPLGRAGASAVVALAFAVIAGLLGLILHLSANHREDHKPEEHGGLTERLIDMAREKPLLSAGAAVAAGLIALRNPALVGVILSAVMKKPDHHRR